MTSVWADSGFIAEARGITEGSVALRAGGRTIAGSTALPRGQLPAEGSFTAQHVAYRYTSFPATAFPAGQPLRVYLIRALASTAALCGHTQRGHAREHAQPRRRQSSTTARRGARAVLDRFTASSTTPPLLRAVAAREPAATTAAIEGAAQPSTSCVCACSLDGRLLSDVGGPYVLAPVTRPLRLGRRTIGSFVLSIQDDEGYRRLAERLAGLDVLMYMGPTLVKNSLGPDTRQACPQAALPATPGAPSACSRCTPRRSPPGRLTIRVLIPIPYM